MLKAAYKLDFKRKGIISLLKTLKEGRLFAYIWVTFFQAEQNVNAAKKNFTFYTGSCSSNEQDALLRIRRNFLEAVRNSPLAKLALCDASYGQDCVVDNVRVYCGSNSRKRSVGDQRIITFDFIMKDNKASQDPKIEAPK